jgi:hypothetical protein
MLKSKSTMVVSLCTFVFQIMDKDGHVTMGIDIECSYEMETFGFDSMAVIYCMTVKATDQWFHSI